MVVEEKAIDAYKGGYQKALQLNVYNEFTQKLRAALGRMSDQEFPAENEARARPAAAEPRRICRSSRRCSDEADRRDDQRSARFSAYGSLFRC